MSTEFLFIYLRIEGGREEKTQPFPHQIFKEEQRKKVILTFLYFLLHYYSRVISSNSIQNLIYVFTGRIFFISNLCFLFKFLFVFNAFMRFLKPPSPFQILFHHSQRIREIIRRGHLLAESYLFHLTSSHLFSILP